MTTTCDIGGMATCPLFGNDIGIGRFTLLGLSHDELLLLTDHAKDRTLSELLQTGEIALRRLPESRGVDFQVSNSLSEMKGSSFFHEGSGCDDKTT